MEVIGDIYVELPITPRTVPSNEINVARQLHRQGVRLRYVEAGLLVATARRVLGNEPHALEPLCYIRVELPPLSHSQLYILDCVVDAIWKVVAPRAGPTLVWLPAHSSSSIDPEPGKQPKSPGAATPGLEKPTHLSTVKGENNEHGS